MKIFNKFIFIFFSFLFSANLMAHDADLIYLYCGYFDIFRERHRTTEFRVEYKSHLQYWYFRPIVGISATMKGAVYASFGTSLDFVIKDHIVLAPHFSAGYYHQGGGKNMGCPLEFRSGIEVGLRSLSGWRIGANFCHISNASIGSRNPGEESLLFFIAIPLNKPSYQL